MSFFYFNGNKEKGFELTNQLEDMSIDLQKCKALHKVKESIYISRYKSLKDCVELANNKGYKCSVVVPNQKAIEGEHEDMLYYLHKYVIKWCKKRSLKAFIIRLIGVNIEKW